MGTCDFNNSFVKEILMLEYESEFRKLAFSYRNGEIKRWSTYLVELVGVWIHCHSYDVVSYDLRLVDGQEVA